MVAPPSDEALQTTAQVAQAVQRSVEEAVRTVSAGATARPSADKSVEIATQIASILVLTHGLLNNDLEAAGSRPFDLPKVAATDLDRLLQSRRLVERLAASGGNRAACAVAAARIDAAIERLDILVGIVGGKVGEVRRLIATIGLKSDIDQFEASIDSQLTRIRAARVGIKPIMTSPADKVVATLIEAANAATVMFQKSIEAVVDAIDGAALSGALGGGETALPPVVDTEDVGGPAPVFQRVAVDAEPAPLAAGVQAKRWLDTMVRDHGSLAAAAAHFKLDSPAQLQQVIEAVASRTYDPLLGANRTLGGNVNYLFGSESRVWNASAQSVRLRAGNLQFEQKTYRVIDALQRPERPATEEDRSFEEMLLAARRKALLGEVVIVPGTNAEAGTRSPRRPVSPTPLPRLDEPTGSRR